MFPLFRRIPKFGFNNARFRKTYQIVNLASLDERFEDGATVNAAALREVGLIRKAGEPVKILGDGELKKKLSVEAQRFSAEAFRRIEAAGGTVTRLGPQPKKKFVKRPPAPSDDAKKSKSESKSKSKSKSGSASKDPSDGKKKPAKKKPAAKNPKDGPAGND